jgi:lysophospholipase L1-like esterase
MFKVVDIGAATAHNLINEKSTTNSHKKVQEVINSINKKCDLVMLVLGEPDCRFHIYYQASKRHIGIYDVIDETVQRYGQALQWMRNQGVEPVVLGIPPVGTYNGFERDFPGKPYASPQMLSQIYKLFNQEMWIYCNKNHFIYLDVYARTVDEKGFLKKEYAADAVHLNSKALPIIKERLTNELTGRCL